MAHLSPGDRAPAFTLPNADGESVSLSDFAGRKVLVYFYPAAMTPGCTTQAQDFTASRDDFLEAGIDIVGISPDSVANLAKFRDRKEIGIELLANPDKDVIKAFGAWGTRQIYGKEMVGVIRSTFLVDVGTNGDGTIEVAQYNVRASGHVAKLYRDLGLTRR